MDAGVHKGELSHLIIFDLEKRHKDSIDSQPLDFVLKYKLGQVL